MDTLTARADAGDCDVIAKGRVGGLPRGWKYGAGAWHADRTGVADLTSSQLRALAAAGTEVTVSGVPLGSGTRMGLDRDRDGYPDGDELAAGSDPGNPGSTPANTDVPPSVTGTGLRAALPNPFRGATQFEFSLAQSAAVELVVFDVLGREVRGVARGSVWPAGVQHVAWDGRRDDGGVAGAGLYFARLRVAGAQSPRLVNTPIEEKIACAPERLEAEPGDRLLEHVLDCEEPDLVAPRIGCVRHQGCDQLVHRVDRDDSDRQEVGDDNGTDDEHILWDRMTEP
jgi:hypothetical protein